MIRAAQEGDLSAMLGIYGPYVEQTAFSFEYTVPTKEEFTCRFRRITQQFPWLVWEKDGQVLGYAYGSLPFERAAYAWCGEVSIYLAPQARRKGGGRMLYQELEALMTRQGYRKLYAVITAENVDSLAFHRSMGYRYLSTFPDCGQKFGRWLSVVWMEKTLNSVEIPSKTPIAWKTIV